MKYYEINETAARQAREMWSFRDYEKGEETGAYRSQVDKCYSLVDKLPDDLKEKGVTMADRYAKRLADWYNKQFKIEMMCPSVMVSGSSNFRVIKKESRTPHEISTISYMMKFKKYPKKSKGC